MRIRLLHVTGSFHGLDNVQHGQVVDVPEEHALRYIKNKTAEAVGEERAVVEDEDVETAVVPATHRKRGRPRKTPEWHDDDAPGFKAVE